jgi:hypothetical protein
MKNITDYTTDELITELRKRDEGYFVGIIPITWVGDTFGRRNLTQEELDIIQSEFQESPDLDNTLEDVLDIILLDNLIESED